METIAQRRLKEATGLHSPEVVPRELIGRFYQTVFGALAGFHLGKYGMKYGLTPLFQYIGDATKQPAIKDNAGIIANSTIAGLAVLGSLLLRGKWTRLLAGGALIYSGVTGVQWIEERLTAKKS